MFPGLCEYRWIAASYVFIACIGSTVHAEDAALRRRFQSESQVQWKVLRVHFTQLHADVSDVAERPGSDDKENAREGQVVKYNGRNDCLRYESKHTAGSTIGQEFVACINAEYAFTAGRKGLNQSLVVKHLEVGRDRLFQVLQDRYVMFVGLMLHWAPIDALFADPSCKVKNVSGIEIDGRVHAAVSFDSRFTPRESYTVLDGEVVLDPDRLWTLRQFKMRVQSDDGVGILSGSIEYYDGVKVVLPRRQIFETRSRADGPVVYRRTIEFTNVKLGDVSCKVCTMSAFGLPEPGIATASEAYRGIWLWLLGVAALCLIAAVVFRRISASTSAR